MNMYYFVIKRHGKFKSQFQALGPILIQVSVRELQNSLGQSFPITHFILLFMTHFWSLDLELPLPVLPSCLNNLMLWGFLFWPLAFLLPVPLSSPHPRDQETCWVNAGSRNPQSGLSWSSDSLLSHRQLQQQLHLPSLPKISSTRAC